MSPLGRFPTTPDDPLITNMLLKSCYDGDTYTCPKCQHQERHPRTFVEHIQEHLDEFMAYGPIPLSSTPPPPGYGPPPGPPERDFPHEGGSLPPDSHGIPGTRR